MCEFCDGLELELNATLQLTEKGLSIVLHMTT